MLGVKGMQWIKGEQFIDQLVYCVDVVDMVGCGDVFMGGWIVSQFCQFDVLVQVYL